VISANKYGANLIRPAFPIQHAAQNFKQIEDDRDRSFLNIPTSLPAAEK
jgi:NADH-quinone oxidoreductase subunit G